MAFRLSLSVDIQGAKRKLGILVDNAKDLNPALARFSGFKRIGIQRIFSSQGPGWPQLAESTLERREHGGTGLAGGAKVRAEQSLRGKLRRELGRARSRLGRIEDPSGFFAEEARQSKRANMGKKSLPMATVLARRRAAVNRRKAVLEGFESLVAGGGTVSLTPKATEKLKERLGRAEKKADGKLLGKLASSMTAKISNGTLVIESKVPWAGVHNEGGVGGHGANIPARPFLFLDETDLEVLTEILVNHLGRNVDVE